MSAQAKQALDAALERFRADTGTVHLLREDGMLHLEAWAGHIPEHLLPVIAKIPVGKGIAGLAVERKAPVDICNLQTDTSGQARPGAKSTGVQGSICVPMMRGDEAVGALGIATVAERVFTQAEIDELMALGRALAAD
ncbi:MAG: GAF domain-containing protein [Acidobacteria bacterium]|nr:GAF domain-containing protein [Acidobacteriota bacterium]